MDSAYSESQKQTIEELTQKLTKLQKENKEMGQINQELSKKLKDATEYNQALGIDLFRLDQQISEVEDKYRENMERAKELHLKTKEMKRRTNDFKSYLNKNSEAADLAKKLQLLQEFRDQATLGLNELEKILSDQTFSALPYTTQNLEEKIHFLFWNNHDLERSVNAISSKVSTNQMNKYITKNCGTPEQINDIKKEWEKIKIYRTMSQQNS